jgi:eukaryotic-like serine/threonine-protein kinase
MSLNEAARAAPPEGAARVPREAAEQDADERRPRWQLAEGEELAPGRHAIKWLGGGYRFDAYLTWDDRLHSTIVAKLVRPHLVDDGDVLDDLALEAMLLDRLNHPVVVRAYDAVIEGPVPHLALEHLEGPRLSSLVRKYGPLPVEQLVPLAVELGSALHYLEAEAIVHLDVKPSNVIMGAPPRLIDFSLASGAADAAALRSPIGTDEYMAPEQCDPVALGGPGPAADVWGLGVTLYRAASGRRPFTEPGPDEARGAERWPQLADRPAPLEGDVAPAVSAPIMACLEADPNLRPRPAEIAEAFEALLEELPKVRLSRLKPRLG